MNFSYEKIFKRTDKKVKVTINVNVYTRKPEYLFLVKTTSSPRGRKYESVHGLSLLDTQDIVQNKNVLECISAEEINEALKEVHQEICKALTPKFL